MIKCLIKYVDLGGGGIWPINLYVYAVIWFTCRYIKIRKESAILETYWYKHYHQLFLYTSSPFASLKNITTRLKKIQTWPKHLPFLSPYRNCARAWSSSPTRVSRNTRCGRACSSGRPPSTLTCRNRSASSTCRSTRSTSCRRPPTARGATHRGAASARQPPGRWVNRSFFLFFICIRIHQGNPLVSLYRTCYWSEDIIIATYINNFRMSIFILYNNNNNSKNNNNNDNDNDNDNDNNYYGDTIRLGSSKKPWGSVTSLWLNLKGKKTYCL